jgi:single-strand DNA-binding protein
MNLFSNKNDVTIEGNLSQVDLKPGAQGGFFGSVTIAVSNNYKDKNTQQWVDKTAFVEVKVGDKFLSKLKSAPQVGDRFEIEGKLVMDEWQDQQTQKKRTALKVQGIRLLRHIDKAAVEVLKQAGFIQQAQPQQQQNNGYQQQPQNGGFQPQQQAQPARQGGFQPQQQQPQNSGFQPQQQQPQGGFNPMANQRQ